MGGDNHFLEKILAHRRQPNQNGRIVPVVLGEEKCRRVQAHEYVAFFDASELQHQYGIVVAESSEELPGEHQ